MQLTADRELDLYARMLRIRLFEEQIVYLYCEQEMRTPVHLCIGQEAVAAGICAALEARDGVFSTHRCHGHYLAKGGDMRRLAAELYGKAAGCSGGKGGSMHVVDPSCRVFGTTAIVGGCIPLAVGGALAARVRGEDAVCVAFFGDGASEEGSFHESLNFAALKSLPVVFVLENNLFATSSPLSNRQACGDVFLHGRPYGIPAAQIDGNDAAAVYTAGLEAVQRARSGGGPTLLECRTYRWKAHVGPECDQAKGYRSAEELARWKVRCPVESFRRRLEAAGALDPAEGEKMARSMQQEIDEAFAWAKSAPFPEPRQLHSNVW